MVPGRHQIADRVYLNQDYEFQWPSLDAPEDDGKGFCHALRSQAAVLVDGTVVPCCLDGEGVIRLGNVHHTPFAEIVEGSARAGCMTDFREEKPLKNYAGNAGTAKDSELNVRYRKGRLPASYCLEPRLGLLSNNDNIPRRCACLLNIAYLGIGQSAPYQDEGRGHIIEVKSAQICYILASRNTRKEPWKLIRENNTKVTSLALTTLRSRKLERTLLNRKAPKSRTATPPRRNTIRLPVKLIPLKIASLTSRLAMIVSLPSCKVITIYDGVLESA